MASGRSHRLEEEEEEEVKKSYRHVWTTLSCMDVMQGIVRKDL